MATRGGVRGCAGGHAEGSARGTASVDVGGGARDPRGDIGDGAWGQAGPGARAKVREYARDAAKHSIWGEARSGVCGLEACRILQWGAEGSKRLEVHTPA